MCWRLKDIKMQLPNINKKRITELLKEGKRLDGRKEFEFRDVEIETEISNEAEGSSRVRIGKTEVIAGIKMDVQEPYPDHDDEGTMAVGMEFNPICGERYDSGPPRIDAIEVARVVDRGIRESEFIDFKKLCIEEGEKVWCVNIDIYCINDDGNVLDAAALASVAALRVSKIPVYDKKEEAVKYGELSKDKLPLTENIPLSVTFYKIGEKVLVDSNRDEEDAAEARLTIAVSAPKKEKILNAMQKGGIASFSEEELNEIISECEKVYDKIFPEIEKMVKEK